MSYRPHRYPTTFPVEVQHDGRVTSCYLINITTTGAGIFEISGVAIGDAVTLRCSVGNLKATVQWADDDQCGLAFDTWIGARQLEQFRHAPTSFGAPNRTGHAFTELR